MADVAMLSSSATRHSCKVCRKGFPCGRSLGGHMRSHSLAEMETAVEDDADDGGEQQQHHRRGSDCVMPPGAGGYGLRENPKKTRRLSGLDAGDESSGGDQDECVHGDRGELPSPRAPMVGHERRHAPRVVAEFEAERDQEDTSPIPTTEPAAGLMPAPRRRRRSMRVPAPAPFEKEPEDVALCLIMLSRDILDRRDSTVAGVEHSPEKNTRRKRVDYHDDADYNDASAFFHYADVEISTKVNKRKHNRSLGGDYHHDADFDSSPPRRRYECPGCGRAFQSYQALGGHRASHKRINSNCTIAKVAPDRPEASVETNSSFSMRSPEGEYSAEIANNTTVVALKAKPPPQKAIKFECPICFKVFGSGQALGGHKRSHSIAGELYERVRTDEDAGIEQPVIADGFLDLNLPAPGAED